MIMKVKSKKVVSYIICMLLIATLFFNVSAKIGKNVGKLQVKEDDNELFKKSGYHVNNNDFLEFQYTFGMPSFRKETLGTYISIDGAPSFGLPGEPVVPQKTIEILLPQHKDVEDIEVICDNTVDLSDIYSIAPGQEGVPLNSNEILMPTEPNMTIYSSSEPYPRYIYEVLSVQHLHGFKILIINLYPIQYVPNIGKLILHSDFTFKINLCSEIVSPGVRPCRMIQSDIEYLDVRIENPEQISSYESSSTQRSRYSIVDPDDNYDYVIITNEELRDSNGQYTFQDLVQSKIEKGLNATIVTVEDIEACPAYWWDDPDFGDGEPIYNDTQCHIRNFIKDAHDNWNTEYVLLGGDGDGSDVGGESGDNIIPVRYFWSPVFSGVEIICSDVYYSCLDGSFDSNRNGIFGEISDGSDIDQYCELDLMSDVYIGRAPVDNQDELSNFVRKTLSYEDITDDPYLSDVWMIGEHLGFGGESEWGGNYKDEIKDGSDLYGFATAGIPPDYEVHTLYDCTWEEDGWEEPYLGSGGWNKTSIYDIVNSGVHIINHLGHGSTYHMMKLEEPVYMRDNIIEYECHDVIDNFLNDQYFFLYSQACYPGAFDNSGFMTGIDHGPYFQYDSFVEYLVTGQNGAFAAIANTRFGFGAPRITCGPSQCFDREFFDALFNENIRHIGTANQDSKEDNIGKVRSLYIRFCYYEITLFGDPEVMIKDPPLPDHDLMVYKIDVPSYITVSENTYINATIYNMGEHNEETITVNLLINDVVINSKCISYLSSREYSNVSFITEIDELGDYNISIEIVPVPGENEQYIENNIKTVNVMTVLHPPIKVFVLESIGRENSFFAMKYDILNSDWWRYGNVPVDIDFPVFSWMDITLDFLNSTGADVLIIDWASSFINSTFDPWLSFEYSLDEINAIIQYVNNGHGIIIFSDSLNGNNKDLCSLVGIDEDEDIRLSNQHHPLVLEPDVDGHPILKDVSNPCIHSFISGTSPSEDKSWDLDDLTSSGCYVARSCDNKESIIVNTDIPGSIYFSFDIYLDRESFILNYNVSQILYNAINWSYDHSKLVAYIDSEDYWYTNAPMRFFGHATGGNSNYEYHWDFGDGETSNVQKPLHSFTSSGTFDVMLTVTDGDNVSSSTLEIVIDDVLRVLNINKNIYYVSIQDAIDDSDIGDYIWVPNGTYYENLNVYKPINIFGESVESTFIDGCNLGNVISIFADSVLVTGFTIQNGIRGIDIHSSHNLIIMNNIMNNGFGLYINSIEKGVHNRVYYNSFIKNKLDVIPGQCNIFDAGYPYGGNYWDRYDELEEGAFDIFCGENQNIKGSDGIADDAYCLLQCNDLSILYQKCYSVYTHNYDRYPLLNPFQPRGKDIFSDEDRKYYI